MQFACFECGEIVSVLPGRRVLRNEMCPACSAALHCCLNCRFYDPTSHNQCNEPQAEWVRDKEKANYCDYFEPRPADLPSSKRETPTDDARKKWDELFKK